MSSIKPVVESHTETNKTLKKNVSLREQVNAALDDLDKSTQRVRVLVDKLNATPDTDVLNIENGGIIVEKQERKRIKWFWQ